VRRPVLFLLVALLSASAHAQLAKPGEWVVRRADEGVVQEKDLAAIPAKVVDAKGEHDFAVVARYPRVMGIRTDSSGAEVLRARGFTVEPNYEFKLLGGFFPVAKAGETPWHLRRIAERGNTGPLSMLPAANGVAYVLDTYAYDGLSGEQFGDRLVRGPDFTTGAPDDPKNPGCRVHGTGMAALIHAVNPSALIVSIRIGRCDNTIDGVAAYAAFDWLADTAAHAYGPGPVNMSWGSMLGRNPYAKEFAKLGSLGFVTVAGAGNDGGDASKFAPCAWADLCVGATDEADAAALFSNSGSVVDVFAPGVDIDFVGPDGNEWSASGTSASTPLVSGVWTLLRGAFPSLPTGRVTALLVANATKGVLSDIGTGSPNRLLYAGAVVEQVGQIFFRYSRAGKKFTGRVQLFLNEGPTLSQWVDFFRGGKGSDGHCQGRPYVRAKVDTAGFATAAVTGWGSAPARGCFQTELGAAFERQVTVLP
jgi:subtilisin family serine protease